MVWLSQTVDLVLIEGGKSSPFPKIEVVRGQVPLLPPNQLVASLGDPVASLPHHHALEPGVPWGTLTLSPTLNFSGIIHLPPFL